MEREDDPNSRKRKLRGFDDFSDDFRENNNNNNESNPPKTLTGTRKQRKKKPKLSPREQLRLKMLKILKQQGLSGLKFFVYQQSNIHMAFQTHMPEDLLYWMQEMLLSSNPENNRNLLQSWWYSLHRALDASSIMEAMEATTRLLPPGLNLAHANRWMSVVNLTYETRRDYRLMLYKLFSSLTIEGCFRALAHRTPDYTEKVGIHTKVASSPFYNDMLRDIDFSGSLNLYATPEKEKEEEQDNKLTLPPYLEGDKEEQRFPPTRRDDDDDEDPRGGSVSHNSAMLNFALIAIKESTSTESTQRTDKQESRNSESDFVSDFGADSYATLSYSAAIAAVIGYSNAEKQ